MKFAFYIEPYHVYHSNFYTYRLLGDEFMKHGHTFSYYTPIDFEIDSLKRVKKKKIGIKALKTIYEIDINIGFPEAEKYDVLLLESQYYKGWCDIDKDMRTLMAAKFSIQNKIVIVLHDSMMMETRIIPLNNIIYGTTSSNLLKIDNKHNRKLSHFSMPPIQYLINPKPNRLIKSLFYAKYGLDPNLKIIAFLPGKLDKWRKRIYQTQPEDFKFKRDIATQNFFINNQQIHWVVNNCCRLVETLRQLGYQLVGKMHLRDFCKFKKDDKCSRTLMKNNITYIHQYDLYELLEYADYALTFGSTMVYQMYLYNIPSIELGTGFYFPGWAYSDTDDYSYMDYIHNFNKDNEMIYGHVINFNQFCFDMEEYLKRIFQIKYKIDDFKYKNNNPIYGDSYGKQMDTIYKNVTKISTAIYLKNIKEKLLNKKR